MSAGPSVAAVQFRDVGQGVGDQALLIRGEACRDAVDVGGEGLQVVEQILLRLGGALADVALAVVRVWCPRAGAGPFAGVDEPGGRAGGQPQNPAELDRTAWLGGRGEVLQSQ